MGLFKALKADLSAKLGVIKEEAKASDIYQDTKKAAAEVKKSSTILTEPAKELGKSALNGLRETKAGVMKSLAKEFAGSMPNLSKALRDSARETKLKIINSEKQS